MAYTRVNWQDSPSTATPISASNLNKMDKGIKDLEDSLATVATTGDYDDLIDTPNLSTVATSGSYNDLTNKPQEHLVNIGTSVDSSYNTNLIKSKNLFDGILEQGGYGVNGEKISNNDNYRNANKVPVKPNTTYTTSINGVAQQYVMSYYKSDGTFISNADNRTGTFTTPANCYFVNFRCYVADYTSNFASLKVQFEEGSSASTYSSFIPNSIKVNGYDYTETIGVGTSVNSANRVNVLHSKNLFDKDTMVYGYAWNNSANSGTSVCYVKCKPNTKYTINYTGIDNSTITFAWVEKTSKSATDRTTVHYDVANNSIFTTTATSNYIVIQFSKTNISESDFANVTMMIAESDIALPYEPYITPSIVVDNDEIYRKEVDGKGIFTHSSINYGDAFYHKLGNLVIVNIQDLQVSTAIPSGGQTKIGEGFPKNISATDHIAEFGVLENYNNGSTAYTIRVIIDTNGDLLLNYSSIPANQRFYGIFVYITNE